MLLFFTRAAAGCSHAAAAILLDMPKRPTMIKTADHKQNDIADATCRWPAQDASSMDFDVTICSSCVVAEGHEEGTVVWAVTSCDLFWFVTSDLSARVDRRRGFDSWSFDELCHHASIMLTCQMGKLLLARAFFFKYHDFNSRLLCAKSICYVYNSCHHAMIMLTC